MADDKGREPDSSSSGDSVTLLLERAGSGDDPKTIATLAEGGARQTAMAQTVAVDSSGSEPRAVDPSPVALSMSERYQDKKLLGAGGMGEVWLRADGWIGREIAVKMLRAAAGSTQAVRARFLREARVQGQLEHPSIVPVYDLGLSDDGTPFFSMKRIRGLTLEEILHGLMDGSRELEQRYSRRRLLSALVTVCQAVAFAHERGVVHRDLKPANVMLGDFGEVYVLDWGVAKILGEADIDLTGEISGEHDSPNQTAAGSLVGTPGYMSPEQARGENAAVGPTTDVYALGAILFEVLALAPLHSGRNLTALLASTLSSENVAPSARNPSADIAPELDQICAKALAREADSRYADAGELAAALDRFLDGERDEEQRKKLASHHLAAAREALAADPRNTVRTNAMKDLGRALALDPANPEAVELLTDWVAGASSDLPPEAEQALRQVELRDRARSARLAALSYGAWFLFAPFLYWMGVRDWICLGIMEAAVLLVVAYTSWMGLTGKASPRYMRRAIPLNFVAISTLACFFGPFVLVPGVAGSVAAILAVSLRANRITRQFLIATSVGAVFLPAGLQMLGVLPQSYAFEDGVIKILPWAVDFPHLPTYAFLALSALVQLVVAMVMVGRSVEQVVSAERQNFAQAWRLRQLLPADDAARGAA